MDDLTQKEKILRTLFESQKKTGEIAKALGYATEKGIGKYNVVGDALKNLESAGFIKSKLEKVSGARGPTPTVYYVIYEIPNLHRMWDEYSQLRPTMQKNDKIISMLVEKHFWLIDYKAELEKKKVEHEAELKASHFDCDGCLQLSQPPLCGEDEQFRYKCIELSKELSKNPKLLVDPKWEALTQETEERVKKSVEEIQSQLRMEFKKRLRLSPHFFELCLTSEHIELKEQFDLIYGYTVDKHLKKHPTNIFTSGDEPGLEQWAYFIKIFEICVFHDILEEKASDEAIRELSTTNEYRAHVSEDIERLNLLTYYRYPRVLQLKYEQEWGAPKPLKSIKLKIRNKPE